MNNSAKKGWVRIHRRVEDNELWFLESFTRAQAWIDLFLNANHKDGITLIRENMVSVKRGQIAWSEITMTKRWRWSKGKVRNFLKYLEKTKQIVQQKSNVTTLISILNYEKYQSDVQQTVQQDIPQEDHRQDTNKNGNNVKEWKEAEWGSVKNEIPPTIEFVRGYCAFRKNSVDAETWINHYTSNGWKVGKTKMVDWQAAVRTWEKSSKFDKKIEIIESSRPKAEKA